MDQSFKDSTYDISQDSKGGKVKIADEVVTSIAALAAMEVEGVAGMSGNGNNEILNIVGVKNPNKSSKVEVIGKSVKIELAICIKYGYNIPSTCQQVQVKVKNAVENTTGLEVTDVNIRIAEIDITSEKENK